MRIPLGLCHEGFPLLMNVRSSAAARVLLTSLRCVLTVSFVPLGGNVARLDTSTEHWLLELDSGSSADDHCWAMIDVLRILSFGVEGAEFARQTPRLRLVAPLS
jgi:hypothetical protein